MRLLLNSNERFDAVSMGYDAPCDPHEDGRGLIVSAEAHEAFGPRVVLNGPDGEVELVGEAEVKAVIAALTKALGLNIRAVAQVMAAE
jgi:hypothetical protein